MGARGRIDWTINSNTERSSPTREFLIRKAWAGLRDFDFERPPADTEAAGRPPCELHWCGRVRHTWLPERAGKQPCCSRTG